ncbi:unnamed protein product [Prunus brigantina]
MTKLTKSAFKLALIWKSRNLNSVCSLSLSQTQKGHSSQNQTEPPNLRSKVEIKTDKISNLPSDVIEKILLLLPIRDAVRTSVLSSKWRYKSAMLPHLKFDSLSVSTIKQTTFANIVDQVLLLHIGPICSFLLSRPDDFLANSDIERWILHLSRNSIKEFTLENWKGHLYEMPSCFFSCQDMTHLDLYRCLLQPPSTFKGFRSLKSLCMENVTLAQDEFKHLIVCCPMLKTLRLLNCDGLRHLKMDAPKLELLEVEVDEGVFEMVNLQNTLNVAEVSITLAINDDLIQVPDSNLVQFFVHFPHILRLTIGRNFLKYLAVRALPGKLPQPCLCLKFLSISIRFKALKEILAALYLLRSSPALQELEIFAHHEDQDVVGEVNSWLDDNQNCQFTELQRVKMISMSGGKHELDFIRFLLLSSPVLERMTVKPASYNGSSELLKKLLWFRRASLCAEIIYLDP